MRNELKEFYSKFFLTKVKYNTASFNTFALRKKKK